jgi:hypothetical protein
LSLFILIKEIAIIAGEAKDLQFKDFCRKSRVNRRMTGILKQPHN